MTDFVLSPANYMRPWRSPWGAFPTRTCALSTGVSSQAITLGTVVSLDANSTVNQHQITASSQTSNTIVSTAVVGVSAENTGARSSTTTQGTLIPVWEANPQVEFRANTRAATLASTLVGTARDILWDSTLKIALINVGASCLGTQIARVIVTGLIDNIGDSGGAVSFRFCATDPLSSLSTGRLLAFYR